MNYFSKLFNSVQALQYCPVEFLLFLLIYVIQTPETHSRLQSICKENKLCVYFN